MKKTVPLLSTIAPAAVAVPPGAILVLLGIGLLWLLSKKEPVQELEMPESPAPEEPPAKPSEPARQPARNFAPKPEIPKIAIPLAKQKSKKSPLSTGKRILREDVAEALAYGARRLTRNEAVGALEALGFRKTAAYKALSPDGKFASLIEVTPDGLIEWKG